MEHLLTERPKPLKRPPCWPGGSGLAHSWIGRHLELAGQVVSKCTAQQVNLVDYQAPARHVVCVSTGLELREQTLLGAATVVEGHDVLNLSRLVRHDDLEVVAIDVRDEEVKLDGARALFLGPRPDKHEAEASIPFLGLPW